MAVDAEGGGVDEDEAVEEDPEARGEAPVPRARPEAPRHVSFAPSEEVCSINGVNVIVVEPYHTGGARAVVVDPRVSAALSFEYGLVGDMVAFVDRIAVAEIVAMLYCCRTLGVCMPEGKAWAMLFRMP